MALKLIYTTVPDEKTGKKLAYKLLEDKLIACANLFSPHTAIYPWKDKIEESKEMVMILKTNENSVDSAIARLVELHPYETTCAFAIDTEKADSEFLKWVEEETNG